MVSYHYALLYLLLFSKVEAIVRQYYIAAVELDWDYAPAHFDKYNDKPLAESIAVNYTVRTKDRIGSTYKKAIYRRYTDDTFSNIITSDPSYGFLGPVIRGEMGDQIRIMFFNNASKPFNLHPHPPKGKGDIPKSDPIEPGEKYIYVWDVPMLNDTAMGNLSSTLWTYQSLVDPHRDLQTGLIGPLVVYKQGMLSDDYLARPQAIDREIFTIMMISDENVSHFISESSKSANIQDARLKELLKNDDFIESNKMYHINGFVFNNNPGIHLPLGSKVRWYVISFGLIERDRHTAHWHGGTLLMEGHRVDVVELAQSSFETLDMVPDNPGQWLFHCHVANHLMSGMSAFYQVDEPETGDSEGG
ncbi:Cupredoxin [Umbelopsis sp. PMI_123]|nr:Cupredoxin [Umbelopsis sp. PMI_123]